MKYAREAHEEVLEEKLDKCMDSNTSEEHARHKANGKLKTRIWISFIPDIAVWFIVTSTVRQW